MIQVHSDLLVPSLIRLFGSLSVLISWPLVPNPSSLVFSRENGSFWAFLGPIVRGFVVIGVWGVVSRARDR
jgi:hypothetical protein